MKKYIFTLIALFCILTGASSMTYEQARDQALFLSDKMAYELNLTQEQYEACYEINLDYLMSVNTVDDVYAACWRQRCMDMQYIMYDWQYRSFCEANYFYRPLFWDGGYWHFGIYSYYPRRDFFYFDHHTTVFISYRGGHSWRHNGGRSWYVGRRDHYRPGGHHIGMRDTHSGLSHRGGGTTRNSGRGNYTPNNSGINHNNLRSHDSGSRNNDRNNNGYTPRQSSTRTTVGSSHQGSSRTDVGRRDIGSRSSSYNGSRSSSSYGSRSTSSSSFRSSGTTSRSGSSFRSSGSGSGGSFRSSGSSHSGSAGGAGHSSGMGRR